MQLLCLSVKVFGIIWHFGNDRFMHLLNFAFQLRIQWNLLPFFTRDKIWNVCCFLRCVHLHSENLSQDELIVSPYIVISILFICGLVSNFTKLSSDSQHQFNPWKPKGWVSMVLNLIFSKTAEFSRVPTTPASW